MVLRAVTSAGDRLAGSKEGSRLRVAAGADEDDEAAAPAASRESWGCTASRRSLCHQSDAESETEAEAEAEAEAYACGGRWRWVSSVSAWARAAS